MEYFKDIKDFSIFNKSIKVNKHITSEKQDIINIQHIASYECSRKCMSWELMEYPAYIIIPDNIYEYIKNGFCLAGGAIIDLIEGREPKDWDLFILPTTNLKYLNSINFLNQKKYETINSIGYGNIQIIKRLYDSPEHIIGGFDLDASRFIYYGSEPRILCTPSAYLSLQNKEIYINLNCCSETFGYRINKYKYYKNYKTYSIEYINLKNLPSASYNYGKTISTNILFTSETKEARENLMFLMKEQYSRLYISVKKFTKEDFKNILIYIHNKEKKKMKLDGYYKGYPFNPRFMIHNKITGDNIKGFTAAYGVYKTEIYIDGKHYRYPRTIDNMHMLRLNCLDIRYKYYEQITTYRITNPTTQFTGSFYPTPYKYEKKFLKYIPEIIPLYLGCKKYRVPKYIINKIMMFYFNTFIKEKITN